VTTFDAKWRVTHWAVSATWAGIFANACTHTHAHTLSAELSLSVYALLRACKHVHHVHVYVCKHANLFTKTLIYSYKRYNVGLALWAFDYQLPCRATACIVSQTDEGVPLHITCTLTWPEEPPSDQKLGRQAPRTSTFFCSFLLAEQQWAHISGDNGVLEMEDFVIPFSPNKSSFCVKKHVWGSCVYPYLCMCVCVCLRLRLRPCLRLCLRVVCVRFCLCLCVCLCKRFCLRLYMCLCMYECVSMQMCMRTCVCTLAKHVPRLFLCALSHPPPRWKSRPKPPSMR